MKNSLLFIIFIFFLKNVHAETLSITAKEISLDKVKDTSIFQNDVIVKTKNKIIKSDYAKYNREKGFLILRKNILIIDEKNNKMVAEYAEYFEKDQILKTVGKTKVSTIEEYVLNGEDLLIDNINQVIKSEKKSVLKDQDKSNFS